jgi:hypothetical protein
MREAHLRYLLAVALVVVAGYGVHLAISEQAGESPAESAATTPTRTPAPTTTETPGELAPGLTRDGVDAWTLSQAHRERLRDTSFTVASTRTIRDANGTLRLHGSYTHRIAAGGWPSRMTSNTTATRIRELGYAGYYDVESWNNDTVALFAITRENGSTIYQRRGAHEVASGATHWSDLYQLLGTVNTTVVDRLETNGTTRYVVVATSQPDSRVFGTPRANVTVTVVVDEEGLAHRYTASYDTYRNDEWIHVTRTVRFLAIGRTTVEKPTWFDDAMNATTSSGR